MTEVNSKFNNMISAVKSLSGKFTYKQVAGEFKGTYDDFVKGSKSDCSQFVQEMFKKYRSVNLGRSTLSQWKSDLLEDVGYDSLQAGDLVFFNTTGREHSHVGICIDENAFIQMGNSGLKVQLLKSTYWSPKFDGAKRLKD